MGDRQRSIINGNAKSNTNDAEERQQEPKEWIRVANQQIVLGVIRQAFSGVALPWGRPIFAALRDERLSRPSQEQCNS